MVTFQLVELKSVVPFEVARAETYGESRHVTVFSGKN
jgi:hypothetical protein